MLYFFNCKIKVKARGGQSPKSGKNRSESASQYLISIRCGKEDEKKKTRTGCESSSIWLELK